MATDRPARDPADRRAHPPVEPLWRRLPGPDAAIARLLVVTVVILGAMALASPDRFLRVLLSGRTNSAKADSGARICFRRC